MTPDSQSFTGAVGFSMFKINWDSRKQANSIGVPGELPRTKLINPN